MTEEKRKRDVNVTGKEAGVLDDTAEKKREAAKETGSLLTSQVGVM